MFSLKNFDQQYWIKIGLLLFALFIAFASLFYTNDLVVKLGEREQKLIDLYAKGLQSAAQAEEVGTLSFLFQEIIQANSSVPVILTDHKKTPISHKNLIIPKNFTAEEQRQFLFSEVKKMAKMYPPVEIEFTPGEKNYIYYKNSDLLSQLKYYPYVQLTVIFLFVFLGYLVINNSLRAEQNRVWVGMAKETAHQLGTPLSSLMAWIEIFKSDENFGHKEAIQELEKDVNRLETITSRFSSIGSSPVLKQEKAVETIANAVDYLKTRMPQKVKFQFISTLNENYTIAINKPLFDWAIENIIKNGVDAMVGNGTIKVELAELDSERFCLDLSDTGKGMTKKLQKKVFNPGFTTKQRGWGLGLTLTKRIVENYHNGKISIKNSEIGKGTTFRIVLHYSDNNIPESFALSRS
ncbi:MAG: sensor histidine kinase [Cytophagales bacterium]